MTKERIEKADKRLDAIETHEEGYDWMDRYGGDLLAHIAKLKAEINELKSRTYCAYCGEAFELDDIDATDVTGHIKVCPKHPMRKLKAENERLMRKLTECNDAMHNEYWDDVDKSAALQENDE
ncbi:MAG: hypothetical protein GY771_08900 [bacterium]|nr:hypothetical protein [bacterium]